MFLFHSRRTVDYSRHNRSVRRPTASRQWRCHSTQTPTLCSRSMYPIFPTAEYAPAVRPDEKCPKDRQIRNKREISISRSVISSYIPNDSTPTRLRSISTYPRLPSDAIISCASRSFPPIPKYISIRYVPPPKVKRFGPNTLEKIHTDKTSPACSRSISGPPVRIRTKNRLAISRACIVMAES